MLTILNVAFPFAPIGPDPAGGAEQVVAALDRAVAAADHASLVLALEGSRAAGYLVAIPVERGPIDGAVRARAHAAYRRELERLLREHRVDAIHFHGLDFADYLPETDVPRIATLHLPPSWYPPAAFAADVERVCVSRAQRDAAPPDAAIAGVIRNGVALERFEPAARKDDFVLALGRMCPEKGFDLALRAAHDAGAELVLGGALFPYAAHEQYVREAILPLLDARRRWIGAIGGAGKRALLAEARCLLVTSRVDETSSLVAMEALASGTPVVGFRRGALPELIDHGRTGWLVDDAADLPGAIAAAGELSPRDCRDAAEARCSGAEMAARYLELYERRARPERRPVRAAVQREAPLDAGLLTRDDELTAIAADWDALCDRCPWATPFQRPAWLLAWRRRFGDGGEPRVIALRRAGRLVGLVPLERRGDALRAIGAGISDYIDAILEPDVDPRGLSELVRLAGAGARTLELAGVRERSPLHELGRALGAELACDEPSPVVAMAACRMPPRLAHERRRLARAGDVGWEYEDGDPRDLLDGLFALHRERWASRGERGVLADPAVQAFHRDAAAALHARGVLRLVGLRLEGRLAAVVYGFLDHGRFLFYLQGFAPEAARVAPGKLVVAHAIERARDDGAFELDFLRGCEPYKYAWGAVDRPSSILVARLGKDDHARDPVDDR